jgi:acetyl-CoA carboxylase carboxyl transferase subunit alpha
MNAYEKIKLTRRADRPTAKDYIAGIFTDFVEMHGDRRFADDRAVIAGLAMLGDAPVTVIGIEKGHDIAERLDRNFGRVSPEGYRKALRQMKLAEKFRRPVICIVDTQGAYCGKGAEERGEGQAIAENLSEMMTLGTPILSLIIGEGGSGGALALSVADEVWMFENAYYSVTSPEACASILYKDPTKASEAAEHLHVTAQEMLDFGIIERIVREPKDFSDRSQLADFMDRLRRDIEEKVAALKKESIAKMLEDRYGKHRRIGRRAE